MEKAHEEWARLTFGFEPADEDVGQQSADGGDADDELNSVSARSRSPTTTSEAEAGAEADADEVERDPAARGLAAV